MAVQTEGRTAHRAASDPSSSVIPTGQLSPSHGIHSSVSTLGAHSTGNLSGQGDLDLTRRLSLGPVGSPPSTSGATWMGGSSRLDGSDGQRPAVGSTGIAELLESQGVLFVISAAFKGILIVPCLMHSMISSSPRLLGC